VVGSVVEGDGFEDKDFKLVGEGLRLLKTST
jgi:hypothetical protein